MMPVLISAASREISMRDSSIGNVNSCGRGLIWKRLMRFCMTGQIEEKVLSFRCGVEDGYSTVL